MFCRILFRPLPPMPILPRPLASSGVTAVIDEEDGDLIVPNSALFVTDSALWFSGAQVKGKIVHRLPQAPTGFRTGERAGALALSRPRGANSGAKAERGRLCAAVYSDLWKTLGFAACSARVRGRKSPWWKRSGCDGRTTGRPFLGRIDRLGVVDDRVFVADLQGPPCTAARPGGHTLRPSRPARALPRGFISLFRAKNMECLLGLHRRAASLFLTPKPNLKKPCLTLRPV